MRVLSGCLQPLWPTSETETKLKGKHEELWVIGQERPHMKEENKLLHTQQLSEVISCKMLHADINSTRPNSLKSEKVNLMKYFCFKWSVLCVVVSRRGQLSVCHPFIIIRLCEPTPLSLSLLTNTDIHIKANTRTFICSYTDSQT